jgi:dipeptidyl aminopeptidase/acylaminoacyl peptidase
MAKYLVFLFNFILCVGPLSAKSETLHGFLQSSVDAKPIEYFWSKPEEAGPFPMLVLIHPDQESPKNGGLSFVESGQLDYWSKKGILTVAISQPGYGQSEGPPDFCGSRTQQAVIDVIDFFKAKTEMVSERVFIYGGSRGATVASMIATKIPSLSGVILKSGVYDFVAWSKLSPWFDPIKLTMLWEIGWLNETKLRERSAIYFADKIQAPVLIIHGTLDDRAPLSIAAEFSEAIVRSGGHAEFVKVESEHVIPMPKIADLMESFINKH